MTLGIVFYKSSSKYYDPTCSKCERFDSYVCEKNKNALQLDIEEVKSNIALFIEILDAVRNWSKTEYYLDDNMVSLQAFDSIVSVLRCENKCKQCIVQDEFCYSEEGWGCKHLNSIALRQPSYYSYHNSRLWYEIGHFEDDKWIVDKPRILEILKKEICEKQLSACGCFELARIENAIQVLPSSITITDDEECEWEYKYREAPLGLKQTEIIGIMPREKSHSRSGLGFGISIRTDFNQSENEDRKDELKEIPSVTFSDIGGIDEIVQQVREVIELPMVAPAIFSHYHIKPHKGILLYGPPGCGKTLIAKAVANEINAHFISVNGPEILNKYIGQSEENLRKIFEEAKRLSPTIIYFDEFDSIASKRDAEGNPLMATVVNQLLTLMDGMDESKQICAIASTNRIDMIDEAIRRPGRFDYVIEISKPSLEGCKSIFRIHTAKMPVDIKLDKDRFVEKHLVGCTGAEIAFVASEAAYNSIRRTVDIAEIFSKESSFEVSEEHIITECDFLKAVQMLKESRKRADTAKFRYNLV